MATKTTKCAPIKTTTWQDTKAKLATPTERQTAARARIRSHVLSYRLAELRERAGWTQTQLAQAMGVTQPRVSKIERGELDATEVATLRSYIEALGGRLEVVAAFGDDRVVVS
jgi:DNA-binding XRE family transcriptional regulator